MPLFFSQKSCRMETHTHNEYFIMNREAIEKSIKTLNKMVKFYKKNPCDLDMNRYEDCAFGIWLEECKNKTLHYYTVPRLTKKYFKIDVEDLVNGVVERLENNNQVLESKIVNLFITSNDFWHGDLHSSQWVKEAKKVIKTLEHELEKV